jgi:uncharacterized protein YndB with AHSA1/START domain
MTDSPAAPTLPPAVDRILTVTRRIAASPEACFRTWTDPACLTDWWGPHGMKTPVCVMDLRPGGLFRLEMETSDGQRFPYQGTFLEVTAPSRIVFTDALLPGWRPAPQTFIVSMTTFEPDDAGTLYTARAMHWTDADMKRHEETGFNDGWGGSADRFKALVEQRARNGL